MCEVKHSRLKATELTLSQAQTITGNERSSMSDDSFASREPMIP